MPVFGSTGGPAQDVRSAVAAGAEQRAPLAAVVVAVERRREERAVLVLVENLQRPLLQFRREVDQVVLSDALHLVGGRPGRMRLRRRVVLARHVSAPGRALLDRPDRLTGLPG